jgi:hypothetical protein
MDIDKVVRSVLEFADPEINMETFVGALCMLHPDIKEELAMWFIVNAPRQLMMDVLTKPPGEIGAIPVRAYLKSETTTAAPAPQHYVLSKGGQA